MKIELYNDKVNINHLNESLNLYTQDKKINSDIYLIMNRNTMHKLMDAIIQDDFLLISNSDKRIYNAYRGYPIATCEYLKDGEVEIK